MMGEAPIRPDLLHPNDHVRVVLFAHPMAFTLPATIVRVNRKTATVRPVGTGWPSIYEGRNLRVPFDDLGRAYEYDGD